MSIKSLEKTFIYNHLNKANGLTTNIAGLLSEGLTLDESNLEEAFMIIKKQFKFPLKYRVMEDFNNGLIILKYAAPKTRIPTALPFILTLDKHRNVVAVVTVSIYGSMDENKNVKIDPKKLYCMMEGAYLARLCYLNSTAATTRSAVITNGSSIYSLMFTRVLNKKYALNIDKTRLHKVYLLSSKFFLINLLGMKDSDQVFNYALKNCPNGNFYTLNDTNEMLGEQDFESFDRFIDALKTPELGLNFKDLSVRNYLESFISMYDSSALLALESFPYFLYNVMAVTNGAYINNQYVLEGIVENNGAKIYNALMKIGTD